jgi:hypothetical protein
MKIGQLNRKHADFHGDTLQMYGDLFAGGEQIRKNIRRYLPQHDMEPSPVYDRRVKQAHYLGYIGPIVNYFASWLFTSPPRIDSDVTPPEFYAEWKEDCDGIGTDLEDFLRARFVDACISRRSYWCVEMADAPPQSMSRADWERAGLDRTWLRAVPASSLVNWRREPNGSWIWALEHSLTEELVEIEDEQPTVTHTWTQWRADGEHRRWQLAHRRDQRPDADTDVPEIEAPRTLVPGVPLVEMALPREMWLLNLLADGQLEHFRKMNALSWAIDRTCYAMPWFFLKDARKPPTMGRGYYGILSTDEKIEWPAPPAAPFSVVQEYSAKMRDEMHRVAHQMAIASDNNAAAVGRSGESKQADNRPTEIVLQAFGRYVREPTERTLDLISQARGDDLKWTVGGADSYSIASLEELTDTTAAIKVLGVQSPTLLREVSKRVAAAALPGASETLLGEIEKEIDAEPAAQPTDGVETTESTADAAAPVATTDEAVDPTTALNGAQVSSLLEIVQQVAARGIPRATGVQLISASFPLSITDAERVLGEVGRTFFAVPIAPSAPTEIQTTSSETTKDTPEDESEDDEDDAED